MRAALFAVVFISSCRPIDGEALRVQLHDECRLTVDMPECARRDPDVEAELERRAFLRIVDTFEEEACVHDVDCAPPADGTDDIAACLQSDGPPPDEACAADCRGPLATCADDGVGGACALWSAQTCVDAFRVCMAACPRAPIE